MKHVRGGDTGHLDRLLHPRSIAVVGGAEAAEVIRQCDRMGFAGVVYAVNPHRTEMEGRPCHRTVEALPEAPDAAFVAVRREATVATVRALAEHGAGAAVCYASGFKEAGEVGETLQCALVEAAGDMPVLGPNCYGLINYLDGALLWPDQHGGARCEHGVAILTQSSNIAVNLTMNRRGLPIAYLMALGNQARVGLAEGMEALVDDPRVSAIGLHIEGIDDGAAFDAAARRALAAGKPVVALKAGRSEAGARMALSHTASLAGADRVADAYFRRIGIARVHSIPAFLEALKLLHAGGPLAGRTIVSMSCSGGEASLVADAAEHRRLDFRGFTPEEHDAVKATLSDLVTVSNPLDYHTFIWADGERLTRTFAAVMGCGFDLTLLVLDLPRADRCDARDWEIGLEALIRAAGETGARTAVVATLPECLPEAVAVSLLAQGVTPLVGIDDALAAAQAAADIGEAQRRPAPPPLLAGTLAPAPALMLDEAAAKARLAAGGLSIPAGRTVCTPEEAAAAARAVGFPVAVKAIGAHLAHKTEAGALRVGLADGEAVRDAARALAPLGEALLVEARVTDAVAELIVGVSRDARLGLHLVVGSGGVLVAVADDVQVLPLPVRREDIEAALAALRCFPLLQGFRGRPAGDWEAAVAAVEAVGRFAVAHADRLSELDINPLMVRARGGGAVVADAWMQLTAQETGDERARVAD
jgi:acyl-CoA synthetase (NDP forming)